MECAYCGTPNVRRGNDHAVVPVCSNIACYEQYLIEHGFTQRVVIPQLLQARSGDQFIPGSGLPFLSQIISQLEAQSPEDYMNESLSSGSDYSDYERDYEDEDRLDPLRSSIDQEIDFIEMVFDNLREELHTYSNKAAVDTIKKTMKDVNIEITELMQEIEPPCDNIQIVIRRIAAIKRNIDRLSEVLRVAEESSN